jgi:hypothetical protein
MEGSETKTRIKFSKLRIENFFIVGLLLKEWGFCVFGNEGAYRRDKINRIKKRVQRFRAKTKKVAEGDGCVTAKMQRVPEGETSGLPVIGETNDLCVGNEIAVQKSVAGKQPP